MTAEAGEEPRYGRPVRYEVVMECPYCLTHNRLVLPDAASWRAEFECYGCDGAFLMPPKKQRR